MSLSDYFLSLRVWPAGYFKDFHRKFLIFRDLPLAAFRLVLHNWFLVYCDLSQVLFCLTIFFSGHTRYCYSYIDKKGCWRFLVSVFFNNLLWLFSLISEGRGAMFIAKRVAIAVRVQSSLSARLSDKCHVYPLSTRGHRCLDVVFLEKALYPEMLHCIQV